MATLLSLLLAACAAPAPAPLPERSAAPPVPAPTVPLPEALEDSAAIRVDNGNSVFFEAGQSELGDGEKARLQEHALRLKANPLLHVTLIGHADNSGSPSFNIAVAERRARVVYLHLRALGVPASQLHRYGVGGERDRAHCASAECRQQQRRVDLVYRQSRR